MRGLPPGIAERLNNLFVPWDDVAVEYRWLLPHRATPEQMIAAFDMAYRIVYQRVLSAELDNLKTLTTVQPEMMEET